MNIQIRQATPPEADRLTALAHAAKRHWQYPEKWIEQWKSELTITPEFIADNDVFVAVVADQIVGCCALVLNDSVAELEHMWIDSQHMGSGVGRALFDHARRRAEQAGISEFELSADPNAEGFYERMGARRIGGVRTEIDGQPRILPRMKVAVRQSN